MKEKIYSVIIIKTEVMETIYERFIKRILLTIMVAPFSIMGFATTYYVSNSGDDSNSGLAITSSWKTLPKVNSSNFKAGDQVLFNRGGTFYGSLTIKNSGTAGKPIIYGAYGTGANPIITGFTTISGWTSEGQGIYSKVITSDAQINMVLVDGIQVAMGRYPNSGSYFTYESAVSNTSITDIGISDATNWTGAEIVINKQDWLLDRCVITCHSGDKFTYINAASPYPAAAGRHYFIQNDLRTLDQYGEWYHDYAGMGKLFMYFGAINPTTKTVKIATKVNLYKNTGYSNITVDGIDFMGSISSAVNNWHWAGTNYTTIRNCDISYSGQHGIYSYLGKGLNLVNNTIRNCNSAGIISYASNSNISYNTITNIGLLEGQATIGGDCRGINFTGKNNIISYNNIDSVSYNGISVYEGNGYISNNFINHSCLVLADGGGIYTASSDSIVISSNIVLNTLNQFGIYLDEDSKDIEVRDNTVAGNTEGGIFIHNASYITVSGNTVYNNGSQFLTSNNLGGAHITNCIITNNIFVAKSARQNVIQFITDGGALITKMGRLDGNYYVKPINDTGVFWVRPNGWGSPNYHYTLKQWQSYSNQDANSHNSPQSITNENDLQLAYNATPSAKTVSLSQPMIDVKGAKYTRSVTLQAYTSVVLMKDANSDLSN